MDALLLAASALVRGHFVLQSGHHSDQRLELVALLRRGPAVEEIAQVLAAKSRALVGEMGSDIDLVIGATAGTSVLAEKVGGHLGAPSLVADDGLRAKTSPRARVLIVADDVEAVDQIKLLLPPLYAAGAHPIAAAVVARRTPGLTAIEAEGREPIPLIAGITLDLPTYEPVDCPLCAAGEPIGAPGSSGR
jgi:orotate phosphoribosyltransferase